MGKLLPLKLPSFGKNPFANIINIVLIVVVVGGLIGVGYFLSNKFSKTEKQSITVTGVATAEKTNKIASFNTNITAKDWDKKKAVEKLNEITETVMNEIKKFGVDEKDIKTNYFNVYQNSEWNPSTQQSKMTDWSANVTIEIKLRDVSRAGELGILLATLDTSYINGPNFSLDMDQSKNNDLLEAAVMDAKSKAENIAKTTGRKLGKVLKIDETNDRSTDVTLYKDGMGGASSAMPMEAGSTEVAKSVIVTFELK